MTHLETSLLKFGEALVKEARDVLIAADKNATGELIKSLRSYTEEDEDKTYLYLEVAKYGVFVDSGRRPGRMPPREPIRQWIRQRGIRPSGNISEESLAFLIQRKIGVRGIPATPFLHLFYDVANELGDIIEESAVEDLEENINEFIKEFNKK